MTAPVAAHTGETASHRVEMLHSLGLRLQYRPFHPKQAGIRASRGLQGGAITAASSSSRTSWPPEVSLVEVGPRDGLQNEPSTVPTAVKVISSSCNTDTVSLECSAVLPTRLDAPISGTRTEVSYTGCNRFDDVE